MARKNPSFKLRRFAVLFSILLLIGVFFVSTMSAQAGTVSDGIVTVSITAPSEVQVEEKFDVVITIKADRSRCYGVMSGRLWLDGSYLGYFWIYPSATGNWKGTLRDRSFPEEGVHKYTVMVRYWAKGDGHRTRTLMVSTSPIKVVNPYELEWLPPVTVIDEHEAGRTVPIKFRVTRDDEFVRDTSVKVMVIDPQLNVVYSETYPTVSIKGGNHYQANWDSDKDDVGTYTMRVVFSNGFKADRAITLG